MDILLNKVNRIDVNKLSDEDKYAIRAEYSALREILEKRKAAEAPKCIEADVIEYSLTDDDYKNMSKMLKDDIYDTFIADEMEGFLEDHELYDSNFLMHLDEGDLDVCYKIWIEDRKDIPTSKDNISTDIIMQLDVFFWGADRDGAEYDREVDVDMSKIAF